MKFLTVMCYDHKLKRNEEMLVKLDFIVCVSRSLSDDKSRFYLNLTNTVGTSIQGIFVSEEERDKEYGRIREILKTDLQKENEDLKNGWELLSEMNGNLAAAYSALSLVKNMENEK